MDIKSLLAAYNEAEDLISIGAYAAGSNPRIDRAIQFIEPINEFLRQSTSETGALQENVEGLMAIMNNQAPAAAGEAQ